jgi:hypothetical protein
MRHRLDVPQADSRGIVRRSRSVIVAHAPARTYAPVWRDASTVPPLRRAAARQRTHGAPFPIAAFSPENCRRFALVLEMSTIRLSAAALFRLYDNMFRGDLACSDNHTLP